ncbi:MAG: AMP-binding protein [Polyangiaceae bacterium]|nr:AMP-binding protein [Polyangiaceae bacterium]
MLTLLQSHPSTALIAGQRQLTYDELLARASALQARLQEGQSEQVVVFAENSLEWAVLAYGVWAAEKVLVPVDALSSVEELAYILKDARPSQVYVSDETYEVAKQAVALLEREKPVQGGNELRIKVLSLDEVLQGEARPADVESIVAEDESAIAAIVYTSGTTGNPKGVMISYQNLRANLRAVREGGYFQNQERVLMFLPLHHVLPLVGNLMAPLISGGVAVMSPSIQREDIVAELQAHAVTMIIGVPRFYELLMHGLRQKLEASLLTRCVFALAKSIKSEAFRKRLFRRVHEGFGGHIRYLICGGAALDPEIVRFFSVLGFRLAEGYGMTECAPMITMPRPDQIRPGYCGPPVVGSEVEIREGEIVVRGPQVTPGYFGRPEETAAVIRDGWLYTGDLGRIDANGFVQVTGRKKEIIVLPNGKNVNPVLSEELILQGAAFLEEAAVFLDGDVLHGVVRLRDEVDAQKYIEDDSLLWHLVAEPYHRRVSPFRHLARLSLSQRPLPRTRLAKLKRHELPEFVQALAADRHPTRAPLREYGVEVAAVLKVLLKSLERTATGSIDAGSRLGADLGMDSLGRLEFAELIRVKFGVELNELELDDRLSLLQVAELVESRGCDSVREVDVEWSNLLRADNIQLPRTSWLHSFFLLLFRWAIGLLTRTKVQIDSEAIQTPVIYAPNHQSAIDGALLTYALGLPASKELFFVGKARHVSSGLRSQIAQRCRIISVDTAQGVKESLLQVAEALRQGYSVVVFPEGTRSSSGGLGSFKEGYARVAQELGVPIVPVVIQGSGQVLPKGRLFPSLFCAVELDMLTPVETSGLSIEALNHNVRERIAARLAEVPI